MPRRLAPLLPALAAAAALATAAAAWPGRPAATPPKPAQAGGPPPAWIEAAATATWLDFGTYCWRTTCADYIPPAQRPGLRELAVARGSSARIHFGFAPRSVVVRTLASGRSSRLPAARVVVLRPAGSGIVVVETKAAAGSASFVLRVRIR